MFRKLIIALLGGRSDLDQPVNVSMPEMDGHDQFQVYDTFSLKDGHLLASELEELELDFEVELNDGISSVDQRFGSSGDRATMTIFIEEKNRDILDDLVRLHFHVKG